MKLNQFKIHFKEVLQEKYPAREIESFFNWLCEGYLKMNRIEAAMNPFWEFSQQQEENLNEAVQRLLKYEPIQYIVGETEFYNLPFKVTPDVLIPRPETEELVAWIIKDSSIKVDVTNPSGAKPSTSNISILDIGTGSGCIAVSLAKNIPQAKVYAIDVSKEALQLAKENALKNNVELEFIELNILEAESLPQQFDIIVSNPPYVRKLEQKEMQPNVLKHEPELALFVEDNDPLIFYRKISQLAKKALHKNGSLYFEINQYLAEEMKSLLNEEGYISTEIRKDIFGNYRMLKAEL